MKKIALSFTLLLAASVLSYATDGLRAFNLHGGGFIVLDEHDEIMAMGDQGTVADMSDHLRKYLGDEPIQILTEAPKAFIRRASSITDSVGPLLGGIMFDQTAPYNRHTPMYNGQHCLTGCVATAMAEIMAYYKYPQKCLPGSVSYTSATKKIDVSYTFDGVTFDWSKIRDTYIPGAGHEYTEEEAEEVAKLMAACGAAVEMDYGLDGSGSLSKLVPDAFVAFFDYHMGIDFESKSDFLTDEDFHNALIDEFKAGRPVYTSGASSEGGHAYVIDGFLTYEGAEAYPLFHFNWGWNGSGNEWVQIRKSTYNQSMSIIRHIQPNNSSAVEHTESTAVTSGIYDILGNRVNAMIPGHIYIVNGKKLIAR